jgi:hypothetical protein
MPRKLSPEHRLELDALYRVTASIAAWYDELASLPNVPRMSATLLQAYEARDLRGLRMAHNDLVEMTRAASAVQRRDLDARLRTEANTSLEALDRKTRERVERIRARGKVTSEEQYCLVREHVEFIATHPDRADEARELFGLLEAFEQRAIRKVAE